MKYWCLILLVIFVMTSVTMGEAPPKFGDYWMSVSIDQKVAFLDGYDKGYDKCFFEILALLKDDSVLYRYAEQLFNLLLEGPYSVDNEKIDYVTLSKTMTNLYEDPANNYVELPDMIFIAQYKLKGHDIEEKLKEAK